MIDLIKNAAAIISAFVAMVSGYVFLGGPLPVTKYYLQSNVVAPLHDLSLSVLKDRKALRQTQLFQWERNNPEPRTEQTILIIQQLRDEIADIDRQIARHTLANPGD